MVSDVEQGTPCMLGDAMEATHVVYVGCGHGPCGGYVAGGGGGERKKVMAGMGLL